MWCAFKGEKEKAKLLLDHGANPRQVSRYGQNSLNYAMCAFVHTTPLPLDMLQSLLRTVGVNSHDNYGVTSLMAVCNEEDDVPADEKTERTVALNDSNVLAAVQVLVGNGASVNKTDIDGNTALLCAARRGLVKTTQYLLAHDAYPYQTLQITCRISSQLRRCPDSTYMHSISTIRLLLKMAAVKEHTTTGQHNVTTKRMKLGNGSFISSRTINDAYHMYFSKIFKERVMVLFMMCKMHEEERGKRDESTWGLIVDVCHLILRDLFLFDIREIYIVS